MDKLTVLGYVWAIILKNIKIQDEDTSEITDAREALLKWCKKELQPWYPEVIFKLKEFFKLKIEVEDLS